MDLSNDLYKNRRDNRLLNNFNGDYGYPFLGKTLSLIKNPYSLMQEHYDKYGPISRMAMVKGQRTLLMLGPEFNEALLFDRHQNYSTAMAYKSSLGNFYEGGLLLRDSDDHKKIRRSTQPAFKTESLRDYVEMIQPIQANHLDNMPVGIDFTFFPRIKETLLDVASNVFVGLDSLGKDAQKLNENFVAISDGLVTSLPLPIPFTPFWKALRAKNQLRHFFEKRIESRRTDERLDTFSQVTKAKTEEGDFLKDGDISGHMSFLLFAAHDTTTSTLMNMMYHLGKNKPWQDRLRKEVFSVSKDILDFEDLNKLIDFELVFKEILRLHPSVMMLGRRSINETEIAGYKIPADTHLTLGTCFVHRMSEWWDDPLKFDPSRFEESRAEDKRHAYSYTPFGGGAHKCIGMHFALMNARIFIYQVLKKYKIQIDKDYEPSFKFFPMPMPGDGLRIRLEKI